VTFIIVSGGFGVGVVGVMVVVVVVVGGGGGVVVVVVGQIRTIISYSEHINVKLGEVE
jgi:hypothetical protein